MTTGGSGVTTRGVDAMTRILVQRWGSSVRHSTAVEGTPCSGVGSAAGFRAAAGTATDTSYVVSGASARVTRPAR